MNRELLAEQFGDELLFLDPRETFDQCLVGVVSRCGMDPVAVYDEAKVINALVDSGMTPDEAIEHYEFNIAGSYVGEMTPMFLCVPEEE
jgi:hypothetical protein